MSLNFNFNGTAFLKEHGSIWAEQTDEYGGQVLLPDLASLVWGGMAVGLGEITAKNVDQWIGRIRFFERLYGPVQREWRDGHPQFNESAFNEDTVRACIGMQLNVAYEPKTKFLARITRDWKI